MSIVERVRQYFWVTKDGKEDANRGFSGVTVPFNSDRFPSYAHMYKKVSANGDVEDILEFDEIVARMRDYAEPIYMEYAELSENLAFKRIAADFFQFLFGNNTIYVGYFPGNEEYQEQFSIYDATPDKDGTFKADSYYNLITEKMDDIKAKDANRYFIKVMGDGQAQNMRFKKWYKVAYTMTLCEHVFNASLLMGNKRVIITHGGTNKQIQKRADSDRNFLYNLSPVMNIYRDTNDQASTPVPIQLVSGVDAHAGLSASYFFLDRELAILGLVSNLNHKQERLTTGENYKDIHAIKNRQAMVLDQLSLFSMELSERYGETIALEFAIRFTDEGEEVEDGANEPTNTTDKGKL